MDPLPLRLLAQVASRPGSITRELADAAGCSESTAAYHLRRLERAGALTHEPSGRAVSWFVAGCGLCPVLRRAVPLLRRPGVRAVADALSAVPQACPAIAEGADVDLGAARWAVQRLEAAFLVERSPRGRVWLREGAGQCVAMAKDARRCELWGRCPVSAAFERAAPVPVRDPR